MVAAAGRKDPRAAKGWAIVAASALPCSRSFSHPTRRISASRRCQSLDSLSDRSRDIAAKLGYDRSPADSYGGFQRDFDYMRWRTNNVPWPQRVRDLAAAQPSAWVFTYRQSPRPMAVRGQPPLVTRDEPPYEVSGMVTMVLDPSGRLRSLRVVPPQVDAASTTPSRTPDWGTLFAEAGLDIASFAPAAPVWLSPSPFDARPAWTGTLPGGGASECLILPAA